VINLRAAGGRESLSGCSIVCGSGPVLVAEGGWLCKPCRNLQKFRN
jgi:hypothetical protein